MLTRCPLRPYKDDPGFFSDLFRLYAFREKGILAEDGGYYDQPNYYVECMVEMDSAVSDSYGLKEEVSEVEDKKVEELKTLGINWTPKK